jgi:hypothetical protein
VHSSTKKIANDPVDKCGLGGTDIYVLLGLSKKVRTAVKRRSPTNGHATPQGTKDNAVPKPTIAASGRKLVELLGSAEIRMAARARGLAPT